MLRHRGVLILTYAVDTVKTQYTRGPFRTATWAHIVNAHIFPGPGVITALEQAAGEAVQSLKASVSTEITIGTPGHSSEEEADDVSASEDAENRSNALTERKGRVVAPTTIQQTVQLAPQGSGPDRVAEEYTRKCVETARAHSGFVMGFISQRSLNSRSADNFISMTPGVNLPREGESAGGDGLGQQYRTPGIVIEKDECDVVIVGRGIISAKDRAKEAAKYRADAWRAYERKVNSRT